MREENYFLSLKGASRLSFVEEVFFMIIISPKLYRLFLDKDT